jgi:hypothetical protein
MTFACMKYSPVIVNFDARITPFPRQQALSGLFGRTDLIARLVHERTEGETAEPPVSDHRSSL